MKTSCLKLKFKKYLCDENIFKKILKTEQLNNISVYQT